MNKTLIIPLLLASLGSAQNLPEHYKWFLHAPEFPICDDKIFVNSTGQIRINPALPFQYELTLVGQKPDTLQFPFNSLTQLGILNGAWIADNDGVQFQSQNGKDWTLFSGDDKSIAWGNLGIDPNTLKFAKGEMIFACESKNGIQIIALDSNYRSKDSINWQSLPPSNKLAGLNQYGWGFENALYYKGDLYLRGDNNPSSSRSQFVASIQSKEFVPSEEGDYNLFTWAMVRNGKIYGYQNGFLAYSKSMKADTVDFAKDSFPFDPLAIHPLGEKGWWMEFENGLIGISTDGKTMQKATAPYNSRLYSISDGKYIWTRRQKDNDSLYRSEDGLRFLNLPSPNHQHVQNFRFLQGKTYALTNNEVWTLGADLKWSKMARPNTGVYDSIMGVRNWDLRVLDLAGSDTELALLTKEAIYRTRDGQTWIRDNIPNWNIDSRGGNIRLHYSDGHYIVTSNQNRYVLEGMPQADYLKRFNSAKPVQSKSSKKK